MEAWYLHNQSHFTGVQITSLLNHVMTKSIIMMDTPKHIINIETKFKETSGFKFVSLIFLIIIVGNKIRKVDFIWRYV